MGPVTAGGQLPVFTLRRCTAGGCRPSSSCLTDPCQLGGGGSMALKPPGTGLQHGICVGAVTDTLCSALSNRPRVKVHMSSLMNFGWMHYPTAVCAGVEWAVHQRDCFFHFLISGLPCVRHPRHTAPPEHWPSTARGHASPTRQPCAPLPCRVLLNNSASPGGRGSDSPPPLRQNFSPGLRPIKIFLWRLRRKSV